MASLVMFPFFSPVPKPENTGDESFCKFGSTVSMKMKKVKISLNCSSKKNEIGIKRGENEDTTGAIFAVDAEIEDKFFFNSFVEGVLKNLYLPKHSDLIKYKHWTDLAQLSFLIMGMILEKDVFFAPKESNEKQLQAGSYYEFLNDDGRIGKIILMEKHVSYTMNDKEIATIKYYDLIQKKKQEEKKKKQ